MITSTSNQQIKNLTALMKKAKERRSQRAFVVEGPRMCFEAPKAWVKAIYVAESFLEKEDNKKQLDNYCDKTLLYEKVSDGVFREVSDTQTPQGILAVIEMPSYKLEDLLVKDNPHLLILESIQDPGNLGTMLRTGEGAGIDGIIMNKTTVDLFNPKTIRSTMGSIYRMPFYVAEDLGATLEILKEKNISLYAAHLKGAVAYDMPDYTKGCAFMIGNEGNGLTDEISSQADQNIIIPMAGKVESLNAAISASLLMYECDRQRRAALRGE